jgi:hypothetical protein
VRHSEGAKEIKMEPLLCLSPDEVAQLVQLNGDPIYHGNVISKAACSDLLEKGLATKGGKVYGISSIGERWLRAAELAPQVDHADRAASSSTPATTAPPIEERLVNAVAGARLTEQERAVVREAATLLRARSLRIHELQLLSHRSSLIDQIGQIERELTRTHDQQVAGPADG